MIDKTISELVSKNPDMAEALHFLGIHFQNYTEHTLADICAVRGWDVEKITAHIHTALQSPQNAINFNALPIDLLVEYLKHNHYYFIKRKLPFIANIVNHFEGDFPELKQELRLVIPLFVQDFVEHIYEEEDTLFTYLLSLHAALKDYSKLNKAQAMMLEYSMKQFHAHHEVHDDQLRGLRKLTNGFADREEYDLLTRVAISELKKLDEEMRYHAKVENEILFKKGIELERQVLALARTKVALN